MYVNRENELGANMVKVFGLVKGRCSHFLNAVLKREKDYDDIDGAQDVMDTKNVEVLDIEASRGVISMTHCWLLSQCVRERTKATTCT